MNKILLCFLYAVMALCLPVSSAFGAAISAAVVPSSWSEQDTPGKLQILASEKNASFQVEAFIIARTGESKLIWQSVMSEGSIVALPTNPFSVPGFYRLEITEEGAANSSSTINLSVVAKPFQRRAGVPFFGINTHFAQRTIPDAAYDLLKLANADLIRDQWAWSSVEKIKGDLQAPVTPSGGPAHQRQLLSEHGLKILHNCAYGNPNYDGGAVPTTDDAVAGFAKYCGFMAKQFGSTLYGSEIWNEPNKIDAQKVYSPLAEAAAEELKHVAPSADVIEGGGAGPGGGADPIYEESVYKTIGTACCTGFSIHPYMTDPDVGYAGVGGRLKNPVTGQPIVNMDFVTFWSDYLSHSVHKLRSSNITEIGWSTAVNAKTVISEEKQAAFTSRTLILSSKPSACTLSGETIPAPTMQVCAPSPSSSVPDLKTLFIYDLVDDGTDRSNPEHNFGLLHGDLTPKMAYSAFAQSAGLLRGASFYKKFEFGNASLANAYLYKTGSDSGWLVLWTEEFKPTSIVTAASGMVYKAGTRTQALVSLQDGESGGLIKTAQCQEWDGRPCEMVGAAITIANLPIFIEIPASLNSLKVTEVQGASPNPAD